MVPFPALITVDHFVSAVRQAAHTINLEAGCEWFAWVMQHLLKGKESFFYPEDTEGSEVAALSGLSGSLQNLLLHTESKHRLVQKVHNWMSQTAAGHQEIEGEFFSVCSLPGQQQPR